MVVILANNIVLASCIVCVIGYTCTCSYVCVNSRSSKQWFPKTVTKMLGCTLSSDKNGYILFAEIGSHGGINCSHIGYCVGSH